VGNRRASPGPGIRVFSGAGGNERFADPVNNLVDSSDWRRHRGSGGGCRGRFRAFQAPCFRARYDAPGPAASAGSVLTGPLEHQVSPEVVHLTTGPSPEVIHSCGNCPRCSGNGLGICPLWRPDPSSAFELHLCKLPTMWITAVENVPGPGTGRTVRPGATGAGRPPGCQGPRRGEGCQGHAEAVGPRAASKVRGRRAEGHRWTWIKSPVDGRGWTGLLRRWPSAASRRRSAGPGPGQGRPPATGLAGGRGESRQ